MVMNGRRAKDFSEYLLLQFPVDSSCTPTDLGSFGNRRLGRLLRFNARLQRQRMAPQVIASRETVRGGEGGCVRSSRSLVVAGEKIDWDDVTVILENHFRCDAGHLFLAMAEDPLRLSFWGLRAIRVCSLGRFLILGGFIVCMLGLALGARLGAFGTLGKGDIQDPNVSVKSVNTFKGIRKRKTTNLGRNINISGCLRSMRS